MTERPPESGPLDWPVPALAPDFAERVADAFVAERARTHARRRVLVAALVGVALCLAAAAALLLR
jgi:hypothetical protein